jgi:hypothetical protein
MDRYQEDLFDRAAEYVIHGEPIPLDIAADLMREGIDVAALETKSLPNQE